MKDTIIIGGGPAGLTAGLYLARGGFDVSLFEGGFLGGQAALTSNIENYPGFEEGIGGVELSMKMEAQAKRFGLKFVYENVTSVELSGEEKKIITDKGAYVTKTVIIATGAYPRKLGLENEERLTGSGVSYCATCDGAFFAGKEVAVIGGGNTAAEDALFLSKIASRVYIVHRRDELRADKIYGTKLNAVSNVEILYSHTIQSIRESGGRVSGITVIGAGRERELPVSGVFVAVGTLAQSGLFYETEKSEGGYIITDEEMRTSIDGVFAIGDVRRKPLRQVITAAADGAVAANSIALMLA